MNSVSGRQALFTALFSLSQNRFKRNMLVGIGGLLLLIGSSLPLLFAQQRIPSLYGDRPYEVADVRPYIPSPDTPQGRQNTVLALTDRTSMSSAFAIAFVGLFFMAIVFSVLRTTIATQYEEQKYMRQMKKLNQGAKQDQFWQVSGIAAGETLGFGAKVARRLKTYERGQLSLRARSSKKFKKTAGRLRKLRSKMTAERVGGTPLGPP